MKLALPIKHYLDEFKPMFATGEGPVFILGTSLDSIDVVEDRERFNAMLNQLKIKQPQGGMAKSDEV